MRKNILLIFVIFVCLMPSTARALDIANFDALQTYPFGSSAISVTAGDINGDGYPDLVAAGIWTNEVVVSLNDGTGHFSFTGTYGVGQAPYKVQLGDMNGDSALDIVVANQNYEINGTPHYGNEVSILLNRGDGTFLPAQNYGSSGNATRYLELGDIDGDGDLDVAVSDIIQYGVRTYLNDGNGVLSNEVNYPRSRSGDIKLADIDADGDLDLAISNGNDATASILFNDGLGNLGGEETITIEANVQTDVFRDFAIETSDLADLDQDGDLDWIIANRFAQQITYLYNNGNGEFEKRMDCPFRDPHFVYVRDFNNDSLPDTIAVNQRASNYNSVSILYGLADGTFSNEYTVGMGNSAVEQTISDLNLDGHLDVATADYFGSTLSVRLQNGLETVSAPNSSCTFQPNITLLNPATALAGGSQFSLAVEGEHFTPNSQVYWNGLLRNTTFVSATQLQATIPASDIAAAGRSEITVRNTGSFGTSTPKYFEVSGTNDAHPPTVSGGGPYEVNEGSAVTLNAVGNDPDGDTLVYAWDLDNDGSYETVGQSALFSAALLDGPSDPVVSVQVTDPGGLSASASAVIKVQNVAPIVDIGGDATIDEGTPFNRSGAFADPGPDSWNATVDYGDGTGMQPLSLNQDESFALSHIYVDNGSYTVRVTVMDDDTGNGSATIVVTVNNIAPQVNAPTITPEPSTEGNLTSVSASFSDQGVNDATFTCSIDYGDGTGALAGRVDGNVCTGNHTYADNGSYAVTVSVADKDGGRGTSQATMHTVNNVAPAVGQITASIEPIPVNTLINVSANFTDQGVNDSHPAIWEWGDGSHSVGVVSEANGSGTVSGSHSYNTPGVYTIRLTVTDNDGGSATTIYQFVVVYDPNGGFVTGGGWINSPIGACRFSGCTNNTTGKAAFDFVSKYKKGATVPMGTTEFQFKAGNLNFHSESYQWLVVAGHKAQFKGTGTINNRGNYGFLISVMDVTPKSNTNVDLFRIKIWDKNQGDLVVYDNQMAAADNADPTTAIAGGSIVIHK